VLGRQARAVRARRFSPVVAVQLQAFHDHGWWAALKTHLRSQDYLGPSGSPLARSLIAALSCARRLDGRSASRHKRTSTITVVPTGPFDVWEVAAPQYRRSGDVSCRAWPSAVSRSRQQYQAAAPESCGCCFRQLGAFHLRQTLQATRGKA
jgi:hypothetical protein